MLKVRCCLKYHSRNSQRRCHKPTKIYSDRVPVLLKTIVFYWKCANRETHGQVREPQLTEPLCCVHTATLLWPPFSIYLVVFNRQILKALLRTSHIPYVLEELIHLVALHVTSLLIDENFYFSGLQILLNSCCLISPFDCLRLQTQRLKLKFGFHPSHQPIS